MDDRRSNNGESPDGMDQGANSDSDYRSADEDVDSMPSVPNISGNSDDDGVSPPSAHPSAAMDALHPPADDIGVSEEKLDAPSGSVHKDAPATDVPNAPPDGRNSSNSSSMTQERSKSKRSRAEKLSGTSRKPRERTAKHDKGRTPRTKPTPEPVAELDPAQAQMNQLMQMVTALAMTAKANTESLSASMDIIQEQSAKHSQFLKPAEPAVVGKDDVKELDPLPENVESESSDSKYESSSSARSRSSHYRRERYFKSRSNTKCPELSATEINDMVVVTSWVSQVTAWAPGADYNMVEFIRVLKKAFGDSCESMLRIARISDPDDVQRLLHCENEDEFFGVGKFKEPNANKARSDKKKKIRSVLQSIMSTAGTGEESQHPRYSSLHLQQVEEALVKITQQNCHAVPGRRTATVYKQYVGRLFMSNRINNFDKVAPEIQSRLALVIVQGSIAPIRIVVIEDLKARLHADLSNVSQNDLTIESAFELMLAREKTIASSESSIAVFLEKLFGGGMTWSPKELRAATCKRACSGCG